MGYIGPRRIPMMDTAMASPMREGLNHTISSRLQGSPVISDYDRWYSKNVNIKLPYSYGGIEKYGSSFANLNT
jgi:hypothetical protein